MKPADRRQLDEVVRLVRDVLGDDVLGICTHGSTATDRLQPTSDLDVLVVTRRRTTDPARRHLVEGLLPISGGWPPNPRRPVELTVVAGPDVRPWRYPPRRELQYGEWLRGGYLAGSTPEPELDPDLPPLIAMALAGGRSLFGPPPAVLLAPVPASDLRRAIIAGVPGLLGDLDTDTRNVILTLARVWFTLATGEVRSKDHAAGWALDRLPAEQRPVLARARAMYLGQEPEAGWAALMPQVRALVDRVLTEIRRLEASGIES